MITAKRERTVNTNRPRDIIRIDAAGNNGLPRIFLGCALPGKKHGKYERQLHSTNVARALRLGNRFDKREWYRLVGNGPADFGSRAANANHSFIRLGQALHSP